MTVPTARRIEMLTELAAERSHLVRIGALDLHEAVDGLQRLATDWGLVEACGQDCIQAIIAAPFGAQKIVEAA